MRWAMAPVAERARCLPLRSYHCASYTRRDGRQEEDLPRGVRLRAYHAEHAVPRVLQLPLRSIASMLRFGAFLFDAGPRGGAHAVVLDRFEGAARSSARGRFGGVILRTTSSSPV